MSASSKRDPHATGRCSRCGGLLPAAFGPGLDALDPYLTTDTGECPGSPACDWDTGRVLGCGAWLPEAYGIVREEDAS